MPGGPPEGSSPCSARVSDFLLKKNYCCYKKIVVVYTNIQQLTSNQNKIFRDVIKVI